MTTEDVTGDTDLDHLLMDQDHHGNTPNTRNCSVLFVAYVKYGASTHSGCPGDTNAVMPEFQW